MQENFVKMYRYYANEISNIEGLIHPLMYQLVDEFKGVFRRLKDE